MRKKVVAMMLCAAVSTFGLAGCGGSSESSAPQEQTQEQAQSTEETDEAAEAGQEQESESGTIDADKFSQIEAGMTYDEVVALIGSDGEKMTDVAAGDMSGESYRWDSDSWGTAIVTFVNGEVANKSQAGVDTDAATITAEKYDQIEEGMSYDDVIGIIGGEGALLSKSEIEGMSAEIYAWYGEDGISNASITFSDGKVTAKAQAGLE